MKQIFSAMIVVATVAFTACNNNTAANEHEGHDMPPAKDTTQHDAASDDKELKTITAVFINVDTKAAATIKEIVDHYLHIKNALTNDDAGDAADGAQAMEKALAKMDKSLFTAEQKTAYDATEEALKEHAEHIGKNGDNIKHQRSHFAMMSEEVYTLVKNFGAGRLLYHDHCPMARDNKGAL
ncbi:MAG: DUF3347 domain-containing protein [Chitinophagaceae bacterium]|nr:DUF3347 domain-containing protein [Chitinophagaceae bacterium]